MLRRYLSVSARALDTLAFAESRGGKLTPAALLAITAAKQLGEPVTVLVASSEGSAAAEAASAAGIERVLVATAPRYTGLLAEELAPLFKRVISDKSFSHFVVGATAVGKSVLPRVAALLDVQPVSEIVAVKAKDTFVRPIYAGNALATVRSKDPIVLLLARASAFPAVELTGSAPIEEIPEAESHSRTEFVGESLVLSERPDLSSATAVVAGGRGLKNKETFDALLGPLSAKLGAALGALRAAVDAGFCDNSLQVGQTGKVVAPDLYVAVGISGAIQHLAGMKDAKVIVAVNKDADAPIFNVADIGLVADVAEAVPELTQKL